MANQLTYFNVTGNWFDVEAPLTGGSTSTPQFEVISAFVNFIPRLPQGFTAIVDNLLLAPAVNAVQTVIVLGAPTGGTFTLTYSGQTTNSIAYNASASTVQAALVALSNIGSGQVAVTGPNGGPWAVTFQGTLAGQPITQMTTTSSLTGGTSPNAVVETTTPGSAELDGDTALAIAPIQARILSGQLETIDFGDTAGVMLLANSAPISTALAAQNISSLIYDVQFTDVVYAENAQELQNFAFEASTDYTPVCLTSPELTRLQYGGTALLVTLSDLNPTATALGIDLLTSPDAATARGFLGVGGAPLYFANLASFPVLGDTTMQYIAEDTGKIYRWTGSAYVELSPGVPLATATGLAVAFAIALG